MCINFNGYHSGGSSFLNVNDCWLLQKLFVYHRYKVSSENRKKKKIRSPSIWFRTPKPVWIRQSGWTRIGGVTTSSRTPFGCAIVLYAIYKVIVVGVSSPKLCLFNTECGTKLMFAPESHKAFLNSTFQMVQGMVKLPRSYIFTGRLLWITILHVAIKLTTSSSTNLIFLLRMSFRNLA